MPVVEHERGTLAQDSLAKCRSTGGGWCVVRFVNGQKNGFPISNAGGWSDSSLPAFFTEQEAKSREETRGIARDIALPAKMLEWNVRLYCHYDGSKVQIYRGRDYTAALSALGMGMVVCSQHNTPGGYSPMKCTLDGKCPDRLAILL